MLALALTATGCGGSESPTRATTTTSAPVSTVLTSTTGVPTTTPVVSPTTTATAAVAVFAGQYVGATGGSGNADIRDDGTGRFSAPDLTACPSCSNASAPRATIDFRLTAVAPTATAGYRATGVVTAESDPANAIANRVGAVGAPLVATLTPAGALMLSFLPPEDVLRRTGASSAPAPSQPARSDTGPDGFLSPSQNIGCRISQGNVRCDISQHDWSAPPKPASCNEDWGFALGVTGQEVGQFRCAGDTAKGGVTTVLPYGSVARRGPFECRSQESGMECVNLDTGHGLFLARDQYRLF